MYDRFMTLAHLEQRLVIFYENYNNHRGHSATAMLPPQVFWRAYEADLISSRKRKRDKLIFQLNQPRHLLKTTLNIVPRLMPTETSISVQSQPKAAAPKQPKTAAA